MATNFPTSLDNLTNPAGSDPVNNPSHASQHANLNDAIEKLEEKVGVNNSAVTTSLDYRVKQLETNPVASYTDEEARNAIGTALTGSGGITVTPNNVANTITVSTDNTIATKTYVDTAVSNLSSQASTTYVLQSEVGNPDGIATLDIAGRIPLSQLGNLIDGAPTALDTLNELAAAINDDASYAATITNALSDKSSLSSANTFTVGPQTINTGSSVNNGLIIKGAVSQNSGGALTLWQNNLSSTLAQVTGTGRIYSAVSITAGAISTSLGALTAIPTSAGIVGSVVRGFASQTANLQEWQDSAGTVYAFINPFGQLSIGQSPTIYSNARISINTVATTVVGQVIRGVASQTANLQEWQDSAGTVLLSVGSSGRLLASARVGINDSSYTGTFNVTSFTAGAPIAILKGAASQTANLQEWQNSAGTILSRIGSDGRARIGGANGIGTGITASTLGAGSIDPSWTVITVKGAASQTANLQEWQNSAGTVLAAVEPSGSFYGSSITAYGILTSNSSFRVNNAAAGTVAAIVKGAATQTANLQEWQNSTGTILSKVDASGAMFTITPTAGANTTQVATTEFVQSEIDANVQPGALYQTSAPSSPAVGQIWIDSDENVTTFDSNIIRRKAITATAGQTVFTADLPFIDGFEQIFMNGLLLVKTTDYTTSNSNTVTLTSAAAASDVIEIVSVTGANSVSTYTQAEVDALLAANTSVAPLSISANTTLVAKKRYFVTSASALTLTLPASPALNDEIQIVDASGNASTYNITVARNANKINGGLNNLIIDTNGGWYTLLYTGATYGWKVG
jgi:hypothetical protein